MTGKARGGLLTPSNKVVQTWVGADYVIKQPATIGELKAILRAIVDDLPDDDSLEISDLFLHRNTLGVTLTEGIMQ